MGVTTWPCPSCGQQQRAEHANGEEIRPRLCPACAEGFTRERDEIIAAKLSKKETRLALEVLAKRYGAPDQDARNFALLSEEVIEEAKG